MLRLTVPTMLRCFLAWFVWEGYCSATWLVLLSGLKFYELRGELLAPWLNSKLGWAWPTALQYCVFCNVGLGCAMLRCWDNNHKPHVLLYKVEQCLFSCHHGSCSVRPHVMRAGCLLTAGGIWRGLLQREAYWPYVSHAPQSGCAGLCRWLYAQCMPTYGCMCCTEIGMSTVLCAPPNAPF